MIVQARDELAKLKTEGEKAMERMRELARKDRGFEAMVRALEPKAQAAKLEKRKIARKDNQLGYDRMIFNQDFRKANPGILMA